MATSRPFAYNPIPPGSEISGTTQFVNLAIGVLPEPYDGDYGGVKWWMGPDEDLGYIICQPVSGNTQPTPIFGVTASLGFYRTTAFTDSAFVFTCNTISARRGLPVFTTPNEATAWLSANGYWTNYIAPTPSPTPSQTVTPSVTPTHTVTPTTTTTNTPTPTCATYTTQYLGNEIQGSDNIRFTLYDNPDFTGNANALCDYGIAGTYDITGGAINVPYTTVMVTNDHNHTYSTGAGNISGTTISSVSPVCPCVSVVPIYPNIILQENLSALLQEDGSYIIK
jgi:hypothetical protein